MRKIGTLALTVIAAMLMAPAVHAQPAGSQPQVPISHGMWQTLKDNPDAMRRLGANLPPVAAEPGPMPAPPVGPAPAGTPSSAFSPEQAPAGSWSNLTNGPPGGPFNFGNPLVLTDGTVIIHRTDTRDWYKLTPTNTGSYVGGTWTQIASMQSGYGPKFFASAVLPDGRVIAEGGEYNLGAAADWGTQGSIYDPVANTWTPVSPPAGWSTIGDAQSTVLANGTFMMASCCDGSPFPTALFNPATLGWTITGTGKAERHDEESWTLLPDGTVLTVDAYTTAIGATTCGTNTERYNPGTGAWSTAGNTPSQLSDCNNTNTEGGSNPSFEIGPSVLMYNGKVIAFGGTTANTAHTALYNTATNTWAAGPDLPSTCGSGANLPCTLADAPATLLPNGNVLFVASAGKFHMPAKFFEYDPNANSHTAVPGTSDTASITSFYVNFVTLPTGQILAVETYTSTIQIYSPSGSAVAGMEPVVTSVPNCVVPGTNYVVSGNQLNGRSQGANYGDDQQAATNYPLVRIVNNGTGHVFYARTFNHSTMTVAANAAASTNFNVAAGTETGASTLYVVANGIPSAGQAITVAGSCSGGGSRVATHDFSGDSKSDIAWRQNTGAAAIWLMNGAQVLQSAGLGTIATNWSIVGQRDFNGDTKHDWLWRDSSGNTAIWFLNGAQVSSSVGLGNIPTNWGIASTGDFNGDGRGDILWRDTSGNVAIWLMNGSQVIQSAGLGAIPTSWAIVATGDFNGDGKYDILWRDNNGTVAIWLLNGTQVLQSASLGTVASNWFISDVGDFNGDGKWDILWRDSSTGAVAIWFLNGTQVASSAGVGTVSTSWTIWVTGDYNGDGKSDFLWKDTSGNVAIWFMNGSQVSLSAGLGNIGTTWAIQWVGAE
jgi:hypothetical protein